MSAIHNISNPSTCIVDPANYRLGAAMYVSYIVLFSILFYDNYLHGGGKHNKHVSVNSGTPSTVCEMDINSEGPCDSHDIESETYIASLQMKEKKH